MPPPANFDLSRLDFNQVIADKEAIRRVNPQRAHMEQIDAIIHVDKSQQLCVGYKDVRADEFWVSGHMPGFPLLPGVLMCEAAAQVCAWYSRTQENLPGDFLGFGGMDDVRFRGTVKPGDRFVIVAKAVRIHRRQTIIDCQGFVGSTMVFQAQIMGVPMYNTGKPTAET
jgi:3-hydroxyacyl-[acyl-carrier-protein] dehydratase